MNRPTLQEGEAQLFVDLLADLGYRRVTLEVVHGYEAPLFRLSGIEEQTGQHRPPRELSWPEAVTFALALEAIGWAGYGKARTASSTATPYVTVHGVGPAEIFRDLDLDLLREILHVLPGEGSPWCTPSIGREEVGQ